MIDMGLCVSIILLRSRILTFALGVFCICIWYKWFKYQWLIKLTVANIQFQFLNGGLFETGTYSKHGSYRSFKHSKLPKVTEPRFF